MASDSRSVEQGQSTKYFIKNLDYLKDTLHLSLTQMSSLYRVPLKTIYDWYDYSKSPDYITTQRTSSLISALKTCPPDANLARLKSIWHTPILNRSFCSVFISTDINILQDKLIEKLKEMHYMLATPIKKPTMDRSTWLGDSILAEFDHMTDFG